MINPAGTVAIAVATGDDATGRAEFQPTTKSSKGPSTVSALAEPFDMTLAAVVQHLRVLEEGGIIRTKKVGRVRTCRLEPAGLNVAAQWISDRRALWERRLDRLGEILAEQDKGKGKKR